MLAQAVKKCAPPGFEIVPFDLPEFDITHRDLLLSEIGNLRPDVILNCAAYTDVDGCETAEELATRVNGEGPGNLAEAAKENGAVLVHVSTDYVFDGSKREPYTEEDSPNPQSAYGRSKLAGERALLESGLERFLILRTSWLYGPGGKNFVETILRLASEREELRIVSDQVGCPTYTEDLAAGIFRLLDFPGHASRVTRHGHYGLYHFSNEGSCCWHEFAEEIVENARKRDMDLKVERILPIATEDYPLPAKRPPYSVLSKNKYIEATGEPVPEWRDGLSRYFGTKQNP